MDWTCLGHACWLCEADGLRVLFDPLVDEAHHGGIFEVVPRRRLVAERLRPDLIMVSHRHPDHFDVPSLRKLLAIDPEALVVTPDPLVAWAAERLGGRSVRVVPAGQRVTIDEVMMLTTPSLAQGEWGAVVATREGAVWNQVDTVFNNSEEVRGVSEYCCREVGVARLSAALVRWQPMLEVAVQLGERTGFNYQEYAGLLAGAAATGARVVVPSSAGEGYTRKFSAMNRQVFPVSESRFIRDLEKVSPETRGVACGLGGRLIVRGGEVVPGEGDERLLVRLGEGECRDFVPLEPGVVVDPGIEGIEEGRMRADVEAWVRGALAQGLVRVVAGRVLRFVLELRFGGSVDVYTLVVDGEGVTVERRFEGDWDFYNVGAGSMIWEVLQGRRHWGDVLLAGALRGCSRAYALEEGRFERLRLGELFVYHGLGYDDSVVRAVRWAVERGPGAATRL